MWRGHGCLVYFVLGCRRVWAGLVWSNEEVRLQQGHRLELRLGIRGLQKSSSGLEEMGKERAPFHCLFSHFLPLVDLLQLVFNHRIRLP